MSRYFAARPRRIRIVLVMDASGSMAPWQSQVRDGLRQFTAELDPLVPWLITLITFNKDVTRLTLNESAAQLGASKAIEEYRASGDTALWDALEIALSTETAGEPALLLAATDGEDTVSRAKLADARRLVEERREEGNWTFLWLNMTGSASAQARDLGIDVLDFHQKDIVRILLDLAHRLGQAAKQLKLEGGRRLPDLLRLSQ